MPLPISLNHINLWMLEEQDGWTLVDTGMATEDTKALWEEIFNTHLNSKPVKQVIVTHMHFDHLGLAGWLVEKWGATLCMSRSEYLSSRVIINEIKSDPPESHSSILSEKRGLRSQFWMNLRLDLTIEVILYLAAS